MFIRRWFCIVIVIVGFISSILNVSTIFAMRQTDQAQIQQQAELAADKALARLRGSVDYVHRTADKSLEVANLSLALAHGANATILKNAGMTAAFMESNKQILAKFEETQTTIGRLNHDVQKAAADLREECERSRAKFKSDFAEDIVKAEKIIEAVLRKDGALNPEDKKRIELAKIEAKKQLGIYEQKAKIEAAAPVEVEREKWKHIKEIISDSKPIIKIAMAIIVTALCIYTIKYGMPAFFNYFMRPSIISETSRRGWLDWTSPQKEVDDLIFTPTLQKQLSDLLLRVHYAKKNKGAFPNVLFYGPPGTGKTAFAKALAYSSGLDYAITSGSEFAKITDLKTANDELRKLLNWAKKSKGLIIFIDEVESLFANRRLATTSKATQDFINTFLALVSEQSQKKLMFVFATNHPFKLDDAITNRIGINVEFTLPHAPEREKILFSYLTKFAHKNEKCAVDLRSEIIQMLPKYANSLDDFSPRAIKFVAREMIINAQRQVPRQLTDNIAQAVIDEAKRSLQQTVHWEEERNRWANILPVNQ